MLDKIRRGEVVRHFVTIPEGWTSEQAVEILMAEPVLTGSAPVPPEGAILPETYEVQRGEDRAAVLQRMMRRRATSCSASSGPKRRAGPAVHDAGAGGDPGLHRREGDGAGRRAAAGRGGLRQPAGKGMRLESRPDRHLRHHQGRPLGRGIRVSELDDADALQHLPDLGLPPTPIANPGRAAIAAVLDPPKTDELYFVADGSGGHVFATTFDEHLKNVAAWRQIEQNAGQAETQPVPGRRLRRPRGARGQGRAGAPAELR